MTTLPPDGQTKIITLSWGSPQFFDEYWQDLAFESINPIPTKYISGSLDILKEGIKEIHRQQQNAEVEDKYIVVGHGATQLLTGLIKILGKQTFALPPYFPRFPIITGLTKTPWGFNPDSLDQTEIITIPNNPNGISNSFGLTNSQIYDLCYNWKTYTKPVKYDNDIMVFSSSKAFGTAGTRIGWAIIRDKKLADQLEQFIEHNTSGVSIEAQDQICNVITHVLATDGLLFDKAKEILDNRWKVVKELNLPFVVTNTSGMFLYCDGKCPEDVKGINGVEFGDTEDKFRLNLGCSKETFEEFVRRYK